MKLLLRHNHLNRDVRPSPEVVLLQSLEWLKVVAHDVLLIRTMNNTLFFQVRYPLRLAKRYACLGRRYTNGSAALSLRTRSTGTDIDDSFIPFYCFTSNQNPVR